MFAAPHGIPTATHSGYALVASSSSSSLFISYETENWNRRFIRTDGAFSKLAVGRGGGSGGTDVLTFRCNGADTDLAVTTINNANEAEDADDEVAVVAGDYVSLKGSDAVARRWIRSLFLPSADETQVSLYGIRGNGSSFAIGAWLASSGGTNYLPFCGGSPKSGSLTTDESLVRVKLKTAGAFRNVSVSVVRNTATTSVTLRGRVNGANGNISITIPAGSTGLFSDLSNSDDIAIDDEFNWSCSAPSSGRVEFSSLYAEYAHSVINGEQDIYCGRPGHTLALSASASDQYYTPVGDLFYAGSATAPGANVTFGMDCGAKKFRMVVTTNTCTEDQVFVVMNEVVATALTFTVPAGMTGEFIDDTNEISLAATDGVSIKHTGGGTGALGVEYFAMVIPGSADEEAPPTPEADECGSEDEADPLDTAIAWPECVLVPGRISVDVYAPSVSPGRSFSGFEQLIQPDAGHWRITLFDIRISSKAHALQWREIESALNGRSGVILVPVYEGKLSATPIAATAVGDLEIGLTTIAIEQTDGADIRAGMQFSKDGRLYRIISIDEDEGGIPQARIWPPLREALEDGDELDFNTPSCRCRLERDDSMDLNLELLRYARPSVTFVEDV